MGVQVGPDRGEGSADQPSDAAAPSLSGLTPNTAIEPVVQQALANASSHEGLLQATAFDDKPSQGTSPQTEVGHQPAPAIGEIVFQAATDTQAAHTPEVTACCMTARFHKLGTNSIPHCRLCSA